MKSIFSPHKWFSDHYNFNVNPAGARSSTVPPASAYVLDIFCQNADKARSAVPPPLLWPGNKRKIYLLCINGFETMAIIELKKIIKPKSPENSAFEQCVLSYQCKHCRSVSKHFPHVSPSFYRLNRIKEWFFWHIFMCFERIWWWFSSEIHRLWS